MLEFEVSNEGYAKIIVVGVGGGGCNAVDRMIQDKVEGVSFISINTDKQVLDRSLADTKLQIGAKLTKGLGAGGNPEIGEQSAVESIEDIGKYIDGADMIFITAGMGGGTGTGAAPVIAKVAQDKGILTVGVVSKPFAFEGKRRAAHADKGIKYLRRYVDSIVVVPNEKILQIADESTTMREAFQLADGILKQGVEGITDIIRNPGFINRDFADVEQVMRNKGTAHMGIGTGKGENMIDEAVETAISSPLLETTVAGAGTILINVSGGYNIGLLEVNKAVSRIEEIAGEDAMIYFGTNFREDMEDEIVITLIATGFDEEKEDQYVVPDALKEEKSESKEIGRAHV